MKNAGYKKERKRRKLLYGEYLDSEHWKDIKKKYRKYPCYICNVKRVAKRGKNQWIVHHKTYENKGHEKSEDLVPLCQLCHNTLEKLIKKGIAKRYNAHINFKIQVLHLRELSRKEQKKFLRELKEKKNIVKRELKKSKKEKVKRWKNVYPLVNPKNVFNATIVIHKVAKWRYWKNSNMKSKKVFHYNELQQREIESNRRRREIREEHKKLKIKEKNK